MKTAILAAAVILGCSLLSAQDKVSGNENQGNPAKPLVVSGKVSNDGKTLLTDIDSEWSVSNPELLKGYEGHLVRLKCYVDTERSKIQILSVKSDRGESSYAATRHADSAFRR